MPTPFCHRTIGPAVPSPREYEETDWVPHPLPCIGSLCSLWVAGNLHPGGHCFENMAADPRPDPAAKP